MLPKPSRSLIPSTLRRYHHHHHQQQSLRPIRRHPLRPQCHLHPSLRSFPLSRSVHFPPVLIPPLVFTGLFLTLWIYKCLMMILFQNRIIYMPSMPPGARREKIADYLGMCGTISWEERRIRTQDGVELGICVSGDKGSNANTHVVILYFQGNASSLPPRLPLLSTVLGDLERISNPQVKYTVVTLSYRGYWTSRGRASQKGLELDALAALNWIQETYLTPISRPTQRLHSQSNNHKHILVLWGQSIGAGVATGLAAHHAEIQSVKQTSPITALILETPFLSIRNMLVTLYPQRWLPYRYLWPFLRNWWDSEAALKRMGAALKNAKAPIGIGGNRSQKMPVLIVSAANDELVPVQQADRLEEICMEAGFDVQRQRVAGALHTDATIRAEGRNAVVKFLKRIGEASSL